MSAGLKVLVSVGTDHHVFDRLMGWVEEWVAQAPEGTSVVVQHGSSRRRARNSSSPRSGSSSTFSYSALSAVRACCPSRFDLAAASLAVCRCASAE